MTAPALAPTDGGRWRAGFLAVFRHEWRMLAYAGMTPVFIGGFLLTLSATVFLAGDFYSNDHTAADLLWTFLPWVAVVFVPALAMGAFSDEPGNRSLELMLALPLPPGAVVAGKWAAGSAILLVTLAGTFPFVATLAYLGQPDWGALILGYLSAMLLLAGFYALATLASALTRDMAGGYVLGLVALLAILLAGWDATLRSTQGTTVAPVLAFLSSLSPKLWLDRMAAGQLEAGALAAFASLSGLALACTHWAIAARRAGTLRSSLSLQAILSGLALITGAVAVTALSARLPLLADLTAASEFTLHPETIAVARGVPEGTSIDFYWSQDEARVPSPIRAHARRTRALMLSLAARSGGRLSFTEHDPRAESEVEEAAQSAGIARVPMSSGDSFYLGASITSGARKTAVAYFDIRRAALLEYDVAQALAGLGRARTPKVGLISPLLLPRNVSEPREGLAVLEEIKRAYDVAIVPHFADALPEGLDVVVVFGATILKRDMLYALDQHVMGGKGLIVLVDPYARFGAATEIVVPEPSDDINDISDLLLRYGVRFHPEAVIGDAELASPVMGTANRQISYPFWLRLRRDQLSSAHSVTANLNEIMLAEAGALTIERTDAATALITTTGPATGSLLRSAAAGKTADALATLFKPDGGARILAAALAGPFESAFKNPPETALARAHTTRSAEPSAVFAVADMDFIFDPLSLQEIAAGDAIAARPLNDNIAFLLNMIEYASGDPRLLAIRSRSTVSRPFTRVADLLAQAQRRHRDEEARLLAAIGKVEGDVRKVLDIAGVKEVTALPAPVQSRIGALLGELKPYRQQLRKIRLGIREDVERLGFRLTFLNFASAPLFALAFAYLMHWTRHRRVLTATAK